MTLTFEYAEFSSSCQPVHCCRIAPFPARKRQRGRPRHRDEGHYQDVWRRVKALSNVKLEVRRGEIHALLGGNGAGKSTLLKILRGVQAPDAGTIDVNGARLSEHSTEASRRAGIAMIFQEMSLIPTLTAAQNIFLNREPRGVAGLIDDRQCRERARELFEEFHVSIDPDELVANMSAGQRQLTEIVKAISQRSKVLVLDEPSSALTESEVDLLFGILRKLKADGVAIIYVSHRMEEIMRIADRATILRDGQYVLTAPLSELTLDAIISHIVGQEGRNLSMRQDGKSAAGEVILELRHASGRASPSTSRSKFVAARSSASPACLAAAAVRSPASSMA